MLAQPITVIPRVGKRKAQLGEKLELYTLRDVLFSFPRAYKDFTAVLRPDQAETGQEGLFHGRIADLSERALTHNRRLIQARLVGNRRVLNLSWFTASYRRGYSYQYQQLAKAQELWVYGSVKAGFYGPEIVGGEFFTTMPKHHGLVPIYPLVAGITNRMRIEWIEYALKYLDQIKECLPTHLFSQFIGRRQALRAIHFPRSGTELAQARKRLVFEEFFLFQVSLGAVSRIRESVRHNPDGPLTTRFLEQMPFELTRGQLEAIADVRRDMESKGQMRRLIQGDVGCGKTVIAAYACLKAVDFGGQVAVMVPTEILARQMYDRMQTDFAPLGVKTALFIGKTSPKQREEILKKIASQEVSVVIGTHALISEQVEFGNLTLAIIDEQHRFGVRQRLALSDKGNADLLVMSATPIPRSLALTLYGDLNTTIIRELPAGRKPVDTRLIHPRQRDDVYRFVVQRVKQGEQAFVVFPLVEESDKLDARAAIQEMEYLSKNQLAQARVGLVHGQMGKAKDQIMQDFYEGKLDVLVSTTVIEVGMNVLTATVMVIENADRFGLAQLHQLRGRVGRTRKQAYCFLIADPKSELARKRLEIIRHTNDGLRIAEEDLKLRGPGDLLGTRQSGEPWFNLADLVRDQALLEQARREAQQLIRTDPGLEQHPDLRAEIKRQQPQTAAVSGRGETGGRIEPN